MSEHDQSTTPTEIITTHVQQVDTSSPLQSQAQAIAFVQTPENVELLKKSLADSKTVLTDSELGIFLYQAQKTGLDPLARQIYVMKRDQGGVSFMTSIDGQRLVAQRTREYDGQTPPQWCGQDGVWKEVWLSQEDPAASRIGVYRKGMPHPVYGVATWKSYARYTNVWRNGQKTQELKPMGVWGQMGDVMLAKCAEALALRKAFPQELSGLYTPEEMNVEDAPEPPRSISAKDALAEAGRVLVEKGFGRNEALQIMAGIADVADSSELTGSGVGAVLEIVHREDSDALARYLPEEPPVTFSDEALVEGRAYVAENAPTEQVPREVISAADRITGAQRSSLLASAKGASGLEERNDIIALIEDIAGKRWDDLLKTDVPTIRAKLRDGDGPRSTKAKS